MACLHPRAGRAVCRSESPWSSCRPCHSWRRHWSLLHSLGGSLGFLCFCFANHKTGGSENVEACLSHADSSGLAETRTPGSCSLLTNLSPFKVLLSRVMTDFPRPQDSFACLCFCCEMGYFQESLAGLELTMKTSFVLSRSSLCLPRAGIIGRHHRTWQRRICCFFMVSLHCTDSKLLDLRNPSASAPQVTKWSVHGTAASLTLTYPWVVSVLSFRRQGLAT